jgi:hypothetical protein
MRTIEATAVIADDRRLVLQLPRDVAPGEHHIVVLLDERPTEANLHGETPLRWEDGLLVYGGETVGPIENAIDEFREERMRDILSGYRP